MLYLKRSITWSSCPTRAKIDHGQISLAGSALTVCTAKIASSPTTTRQVIKKLRKICSFGLIEQSELAPYLLILLTFFMDFFGWTICLLSQKIADISYYRCAATECWWLLPQKFQFRWLKIFFAQKCYRRLWSCWKASTASGPSGSSRWIEPSFFAAQKWTVISWKCSWSQLVPDLIKCPSFRSSLTEFLWLHRQKRILVCLFAWGQESPGAQK